MNKTILLLLLSLMFAHPATTQIGYYPPQPGHVADGEYRRGKMILANSYDQVKSDGGRMLAHDYWNIATAYNIMGQSADSVYYFLEKSKLKSEYDFCSIVKQYQDSKSGITGTRFYQQMGVSFQYLTEGCEHLDLEVKNTDPKEYASKNGYNEALIVKLESMLQKDRRYRLPVYNSSLQIPLDRENTASADSIIERYGYPGKKRVGEKYAHVIFLVIQHSNLITQEKYLPLIDEAVKNKELPTTPLKLLLDRIYTQKTKKQLFGSQVGVDFAEDHIIAEVRKKYNLE